MQNSQQIINNSCFGDLYSAYQECVVRRMISPLSPM